MTIVDTKTVWRVIHYHSRKYKVPNDNLTERWDRVNYSFFFCGATALLRPRPLYCWGFELTHTVRNPLDVWSPVDEILPDSTQYSQETDIYTPGGIRTHNPSKRATADLRFIPRCHKDRLRNAYLTTISNYCYIISITTHISHTNNYFV